MFVRMVRPGLAGHMMVAPHNVDGLVAKGWVVYGELSTPAPEPKTGQVKPTGNVVVPPRNASRKAWAEYAVTVGVDPAGLTRAKIQASVDTL